MKPPLFASLLLCVLSGVPFFAEANDLAYTCSTPPLEATFSVGGRHYSGRVDRGNLFLEPDIAKAPVVRWANANPQKLYTLLMIDFDGNAHGSWPDAVPSGENSPVRHWIVGNIPGSVLKGRGYIESTRRHAPLQVLQSYRGPHIPMVSDRYGLYLFEQKGPIAFAPVTGPITNFDHKKFLRTYGLGNPVASNFFVAVFTNVSPFSGKPFRGNDVSNVWHDTIGKGKLTP